MWKYIKRYLPYAILAALFMVGEVLMDLIQPGIMSRIVDDGVLGLNNNGAGDLNVIGSMGFKMILLVLFGGFCGSMNNVFVNMAGQNIGNENATEKQLVMRNRTSIIIAHRLSTIRDADFIVVMDHGIIVESGNHQELLSKKEKYYELYMTQYAGFAT